MKKRAFLAWVTLLALAVFFFPRASEAAPEAHLLRIDPRAGAAGGQPELTTVMELVQFTSISEVVTNAGCGPSKGDGLLDCISAAVEAKNTIWKTLTYPENAVNLLVRVDGSDLPARYVSRQTWGQSKDPMVGTAWLIALDASSLMGPRYADAREVANQFIGALGPNDIAKLVIFDDRLSPYVANSSWTPAAQRANLINILKNNGATSPSHQRGRPFSNQIKNITKAFGDIGNAGGIQNIPMMQAMVILSNGSGREDPGGVAPAAEVMKQYFNKGRFPEDNTLSPKTPLPVISIYFPNDKGFTNDLYASNDMQFMQDLSNPEIGGFFDIVRAGQGTAKAITVLQNVKARFNQMWVVKWRVSCLSSTAEQSFNLIADTNPPTKPDGSFKDIPIGVKPQSWPLDIDLQATKVEAETNPVFPGGQIKVYGRFCWGGDKGRALAYYVPAGTNPNQSVNRSDPDVALKAMQHLESQGMKGAAVELSDVAATFSVPEQENVLEGQGEAAVVRVVIVDNKAKRASGVTAETVLTLKAGKKPLNLPIILGAAGLGVVILLLLIVLLRGGGGGGGKKRGGQHPPPAPVVAGGAPPYGGGGAPPYGGGGGYPPPGGGGYGGGGGYNAAPPVPPPVVYQAPPMPMPAPAIVAAPVPAPVPMAHAPIPAAAGPEAGAHPLGRRGGLTWRRPGALPRMPHADHGHAGARSRVLFVRSTAPPQRGGRGSGAASATAGRHGLSADGRDPVSAGAAS